MKKIEIFSNGLYQISLKVQKNEPAGRNLTQSDRDADS